MQQLERIREFMEEAFPDAEVWVTPAGTDTDVCVRVPEPWLLYRLRLAPGVLADARGAGSVLAALREQGATDRMRRLPGGVVPVEQRDGRIVVGAPDAGRG